MIIHCELSDARRVLSVLEKSELKGAPYELDSVESFRTMLSNEVFEAEAKKA